MRVAIDIKALCYNRGGTAVYLRNLLQQLCKIDKANYYFPVTPPGVLPESNPGARNFLMKNFDRVSELLWLFGGLSFYLTHEKMDLYHSTSMIAPSWIRCPLVTTILDLTPVLFPETHDWKWVWYFRQILRINCSHSDLIIVPSENTREDLFEYLNPPRPPIKTIPLGIDDNFFLPGDHILERIAKIKNRFGIDRSYIFSVGTLEPRKNIEMLVDSFMELSDAELKEYALVITGEPGWKCKSVLAKIRKHAGRIIYTGRIEEEELRLLYRGASLFVYPSLYEGFGLPPLEAMASGCPVIASDTSSLREILQGSAMLISPNDRKQLQEAMVTMLQNESLRSGYVKKGQDCTARYRWKTTAEQTLQVYKSYAHGGQ
jgi:glycosyltransferase involved in cell wall biosynthesis